MEIQTEEGLEIKVMMIAARPKPEPAKKITLYIRPEAIALIPIGENHQAVNRLTGKVAASAYEGSSVEYEVELQGSRSVRAHVLHPKGRPLFARGDEVAVVFDPKDVGWVAEEG